MSQIFATAPFTTVDDTVRAALIEKTAQIIAGSFFDANVSVVYTHPDGDFVDISGDYHDGNKERSINMCVWNKVDNGTMSAVICELSTTVSIFEFFEDTDLTLVGQDLRQRVKG